MTLIGAGLALGGVIALLNSGELLWLVPLIFLFTGAAFVALVFAVLRLAQKDPTPLVLGEMSGGDWITHRRLLMGDSARGDRVEVPSSGVPQEIAATEVVEALPAPQDEEDEGKEAE